MRKMRKVHNNGNERTNVKKAKTKDIEVIVTFTPGYQKRFTKAICELWLKQEKAKQNALMADQGDFEEAVAE